MSASNPEQVRAELLVQHAVSLAVGWAYAYACHLADSEVDICKVPCPEMHAQSERDLKDEMARLVTETLARSNGGPSER